MKSVVLSDTHIGRRNGDPRELEVSENFFNWVCEISEQKNIERLIFLGDWHDNRKSITIPSIHKSYEIINNVKDAFKDIFLVVGNHDLYYNDRYIPNSIDIFHSIENVNIIATNTVIENMLFIPWIFDNGDIEDIENNNYNVDIVLGHLPINDIILNRSGSKSKNNMLKQSHFKNYRLVLSGHYHQYGQYGNIIYIGAPYHMSFNDSGKRGIWILDNETMDMQFIEYEHAPKYVIIDAENYDPDIITGNHVGAEFYNNIGMNEINEIFEEMYKLNPVSITPSYKFSISFTEETIFDSIEEIKGNKEILIEYIRKSEVPQNLNLNTLENIINSMEI
ncbi:MAG: metallophosphoesterase [archaeon]